MIELAFRADLYDQTAIDAAAAVYAKVATCKMNSEGGYHRVTLTATGRVAESRIADEFSNYALGATVDGRGRNGSGIESPPKGTP